MSIHSQYEDGSEIWPERLPTYFSGRRWDAPMMDDSVEIDAAFLEKVLATNHLDGCAFCGEPLVFGENIFMTATTVSHTECNIRAGMGDVAHLEGRCSCPIGPNGTLVADRHTPEELEQTYRQESLAVVDWLIAHHRGRFHD